MERKELAFSTNEADTARQRRAKKIVKKLRELFPDAKIVLKYSNTWELLVAVRLSAQCTDKKVNEVCEKLFKKYRTLADYVNADIKEFEQDVKPTGFYRAKAKSILEAARIIKDEFGGEVPNTMEELLTLPGVARKTANIVLGNAFGKVEGIAVDTHVGRLSERLGLSFHENPEKIERDLMKLYPKKEWFRLTYKLIDHGRALCTAKNRKCRECPLRNLCPSSLV